ncbi:hypothetical protein [Hymenobacter pini]|uniref:hypothetical protein n=1 Tax=Hymenobacter pini TaxID=2880879 RepID=UPI001CF46D0E|nr:hypothetical protein [Hymenobacter pini]MCA8833046.1 hypothetical protein [Hymenobacter pini]
MEVSTPLSSAPRRRRRRLKTNEASDTRGRTLTMGILSLLLLALLVSLGVIAVNLGG